MADAPKAYTVAAITRIIKNSLEEQFCDIWVEGEISNYHHHSSGHRYITLKDDSAVIKVVIWRTVGQYLKFEPENGQKVLAFGDVTVYPRGGNYQLSCKKLQPLGVGELELAFRQLYEKLSAEGLFDDELKKKLPLYPCKIGVVTSPTSAAIRDIIQITRRRNSSIELSIYPAQVQGEGAEETIAAGISHFNTREDIDLIIVGRGGGSIEDLWAFNTELVVRAIAESKLPIVSGVGHEIDTTLSDLAADVRAATPSAAAELTAWELDNFRERVRSHLLIQANMVEGRVSSAREILVSIMKRPIFRRPLSMIYDKRQYLDNLTRVMDSVAKNRFQGYKNRLSLMLAKLEALSPMKILTRGYSVTRRKSDGAVVTSVHEVTEGEPLLTTVTNGVILSKVQDTIEQKK